VATIAAAGTAISAGQDPAVEERLQLTNTGAVGTATTATTTGRSIARGGRRPGTAIAAEYDVAATTTRAAEAGSACPASTPAGSATTATGAAGPDATRGADETVAASAASIGRLVSSRAAARRGRGHGTRQ
jgi:hypothetical protein